MRRELIKNYIDGQPTKVVSSIDLIDNKISYSGINQNTNIFPIIIKEFPMPDISLKEQQRIVDEIQSEIKKQDDIKAKIAELRSQIDDIIIKTIKE